MPEGDTIARSATRLRAAIAGAELHRVEAPRWTGRLPAAGETVLDVRSVGKHLEVWFSGGLVLRTHMRMTGSWHIYRPGERWRRPRRELRVLLITPEWEAVCFSAPDVEFVTPPPPSASGLSRPLPATAHLGPDLCLPDADLEACIPRFALVEPTTTIAEALLDQRICCGVGNVFKSEICWAARLDPFTPVAAVPVPLRRELVQIAAQQLRANLDTARRTTVPGGVAVYGHAGDRCRRCGASIRMRRHGAHARSTYWCPGCQVPPVPPVPPDTVEADQAIDQ